jgi:glycosyltransferase involved in cell wall biosynthesis
VTLLGERKDMPDALAAADVFVLASRWEGNPLSVMEAMAAGKPVVATSVGAVPELVRHATDGLLVPPADADALAHAMSLIFERKDMREEMGWRGAARASERFGVAAMVRAYANLYTRVLPEGKTDGRKNLVSAAS